MPLDNSIKKVLVIGSGPIVIGQAAEFDYAGAQACRILKEAGVDTLVLGCTHYPLLEKVIGAYMGPEVRLINSGAEGARAAADCLRERDALAGPGRGSCRCFVSDRQEDFSRLASTFLGWDVAQAVEQVDISQY